MATNEGILSPEPADVGALYSRSAGGHPLPPTVDLEFGEAPRHLRHYLWVLYKYRWLAATCSGFAVGLTLLVTLLTPRLYTASTRVQVARHSPIQLRLEGDVLRGDDSDRDVNGVSSFLATQVAALQSRDLGERVIRGRRLAENEAFLHPGREGRGLLALSPNMSGILRPRAWETSVVPAPEDDAAIGAPGDPRLLDRYMRYLSVQDVRGTDLVEVQFTTPSPSLSAFLAAAHVQAYMEANEEARRANEVEAKEFLARQLRESREQIERAEAAVGRFAADHPDVAVNAEQRTVAQRISGVSELFTRAEGARLRLQSRYEFLTRRGSDGFAYFRDRPGIQKLHLALLDLRAQRAGWDERLGPKHPQIVELRRQEEEIEQQLRAEVAQEVDAVRARYDAAQEREAALRRKLSHLGTVAIALRDLGARYELLKNDVETAHTLHAALLKQQMATAVNSELAASNIRVIERADVPRRPSKPTVGLDLTLGLLASLVFALGAVLLCDYFDNSLRSTQEVEGLLQLPTLATIPNFELARRAAHRPLDARGLLPSGRAVNGGGDAHALDGELPVLHEPWSRVAETFHSMRTAVLFSANGSPPKVIVVTSACPAEGKTVGSLNLATALAEAGARVLLLDADLRHPRCHLVLGVKGARGLSSFLAGHVELESVVRVLDPYRPETPRLFFIPAGRPPLNPIELVSSARMRQALEYLRSRYDFVILDTPPVLSVTDAVVLAREADGVVLVVKGHETPRELARQARDRLVIAGAHLIGVVVNNVGLGWGDPYFYGADGRDQPPEVE